MGSDAKPLPLFDGRPLRLIKTSELYEELAVIAFGCGTDKIIPPLPSDDEWRELIPALLEPSIEETGNRTWQKKHPERRRGFLGMRASLLCRALDKSHDFDADMEKWRLAPHDRRERMLWVLLQNELPPLWEG